MCPKARAQQPGDRQSTVYPRKADPFGTSPDCPDWFKINEKPSVTRADLTKAPGFDGTITLLSRINGWITVTPEDRNRARRLGRNGPFDKSKKGNDLRNVSDLAPAWMQNQAQKPDDLPKFAKAPGPSGLRDVTSTQGQKRTFLVDVQQPGKSQFSLGDFRHNVRTAEEAQRYLGTAEPAPKSLIAWPEDVKKQRYERPVTGKVGHCE